jgi:DNA polymerase III delta prime subunit
MSRPLDPLARSPLLQRLRERALAGTLGPSLLLVGPEGSGKEAAALDLARLALCEAPADGEPDTAERKARQLQHPDLYYVCPVESGLDESGYRDLLREKAAEPLARVRQPSSAIIPIGNADDPGLVSVRTVRRFVQAKPFEGRRRVVIVGDAHRMNRQAANALLKTLEEPPPAALLMLCSHQPHLLPQTVRSRCARVHVPALHENELAEHLQARHELSATEAARIAAVAGGNARRALDLLDPVARRLADWAGDVLVMLCEDRRAELARAAERLGKGQAPRGNGAKSASSDASLSTTRDVGMRVLDFVVADLLVIARLASGARVEAAHAERLGDFGRLDPAALASTAGSLLAARADLARNVNVGLVLTHALLESVELLHRRAAAGA